MMSRDTAQSRCFDAIVMILVDAQLMTQEALAILNCSNFQELDPFRSPCLHACLRVLLFNCIPQKFPVGMDFRVSASAFAVVVPILFAFGALYVSVGLESMPLLPPPGPKGLYPGDHVIPDAVMIYDQTKLISAPPSDVWPWVQQVGKGRGGRSACRSQY